MSLQVGCECSSLTLRAFGPDSMPTLNITEPVFRVTNVTPREVTPVTINRDDYNMIAKRFGLDLRAFLKKRSLGISVYIPRSDIGIYQIVKSKPAREALERFILYPLRGHACDDDPLHEFTCTCFRRRLELSFEHLERYLIDDGGFQSTEAAEARKKVEIGMRVLQVCKRL